MEPRTVVVTGASAGVGRAAARAFGAKGDRVALLARGEAGLKAAAGEVEEAGGEALAAVTDVADAGEVERAAEEVQRHFGPIDVWVNNAMTTVFAPTWEIDPEEFERATRVTYLGTVHGTMTALRRMRPRDRGAIVQVGSALAYRAIPLQSAYCGAKFAVRGFTDSLRTELRHEGSRVRLSMVQLPALNTPQFGWSRAKLDRHPQPVPPIYEPEVAARAIVFAARHPRREVWVGPSAVATIVANKLAPGLLDRHLGRTGFDSQQTGDPVDSDREDNLFEPVDSDDDAGVRGRFSGQSRSRSGSLAVSLGLKRVLDWFRPGS